MTQIVKPSGGIAVDCGSVNGKNPGLFEYRLVDIQTRRVILNYKIQGTTTNNIAEFLALVEALKLTYDDPTTLVYSDSLTALAWVKTRNIKTTITVTNPIQILHLQRALIFLRTQTFNTPLFWNNKAFNEENPADYGNKK